MDCHVGLCPPRNDGKKKKAKAEPKEKEGKPQKKKSMDCHVGLCPPRNDGFLMRKEQSKITHNDKTKKEEK